MMRGFAIVAAFEAARHSEGDMSMATHPPSALKTGMRAGSAFAFSVAKGAALAVLLGIGAFLFYLTQLPTGPGFAGARAGGAGAILALMASPPMLVAVGLALYGGIYFTLGIAQGRARAMQQVVRSHGEGLSQRMAGAIAGRIEAMPRTHGALHKVAEWLSVDTVVSQLAPVLGEGKAVRGAIGFVLGRLPLQEVLEQWQSAREAAGAQPPQQGQPDPALRALLGEKISETLEDMSTPSRVPLYIALAVHAALLGLGLWLVR